MKKIVFVLFIMILASGICFSVDSENLKVNLKIGGEDGAVESIEIGFSSKEVSSMIHEAVAIDTPYILSLKENEYYAYNASDIYAYYKILSGKAYDLDIYLDTALEIDDSNTIDWYVAENAESSSATAKYGENNVSIDKDSVHDATKTSTAGSIKLAIWTGDLTDKIPGTYSANVVLKLTAKGN